MLSAIIALAVFVVASLGAVAIGVTLAPGTAE